MAETPDRREDLESRERIEEIGTTLARWAEDARAAQEKHFEEAAEIQALELERIGAKLTRGQVIGLLVLIVTLAVSGIALGKSLGRQDAIEAQARIGQRQQATLKAQQGVIQNQAAKIAEALRQIGAQRVTNTQEACDREERNNRNLVGLLGDLKANGPTLAKARRRYPAKIDCTARIEAVKVKPKDEEKP